LHYYVSFIQNYDIVRIYTVSLHDALPISDGPGSVVYEYLNKVREHAGIPTVQESWDNYSTNPNQYKSKEGLREIIHRERLNELVDRKSTRLNSSHVSISYAVFCLKKKIIR